MEIAYDMTRLVERRFAPVPSGIDRVDLRFALHLRDSGRTWRGLVQRQYGLDWLEPVQAEQLLRFLECKWLGGGDEVSCPEVPGGWQRETFASLLEKSLGLTLKERLAGRPLLSWPFFACPASSLRILSVYDKSRQSTHPQDPTASTYWNIGHIYRFRRAADSIARIWHGRALVFLHDTIPLRHPELSSARNRLHFWRFAQWVAELEGHLLLSSQSALSEAKSLRSGDEPFFPPERFNWSVLPLPVEDCFHQPPQPDDAADGESTFFLLVGDWEPRRNFELLLDVWESLDAPPRLLQVSAGRRKPPAAIARRIRRLERSGSWRCLSPIGDVELARLYREARALLFPSLVEGWGLPLAEALAVGTPVIASDIPVCREVGGERPRYLPPDDTKAWINAVLACQAKGRIPPEPTDQVRRWPDYFKELTQIFPAS